MSKMSTPVTPPTNKFKISTPWAIILVFLTLIAGLTGCPAYSVWYSGMHGRAELNRATYNRQIAVQEAIAKEEAAGHYQGADTTRAHGIARSNIIIGQSLTDKYLHWYFIDKLDMSKSSTVYIPTEASLPILEAGRLQQEKDSLVASKKYSD